MGGGSSRGGGGKEKKEVRREKKERRRRIVDDMPSRVVPSPAWGDGRKRYSDEAQFRSLTSSLGGSSSFSLGGF